MKLLYFVIQMDLVGGVAKIESEKINWLVNHGYEVSLCDIESHEMKPYYPLDPRVKFFSGNMSTIPGNPWIRLKQVLKSIKRVRDIIMEENPDIIINAHCPLVTWIIPWVAGKIPTIAEMHQSRQGLEVFNRQFMGRFGRWLHRWSIRWIYGRYDRFICLTHEDKQAWHLKNALVIPNFSSLNLSPKPFFDVEAKEEHQIIMLARLAPQKRIDLMMKVWQKLYKDFPHWHVKVLGDGFDAQRLRVMCVAMGLENSFFMPGAVKEVQAELKASDVMCLTSEYEGFGIVLIEAMQMGVPVMAFEYSGVHDIIENGKDGYIVPFGDVEAYAQKLRTLMTSADERHRLATNALESVKKFEKEQVMQQWNHLFNRL